MRGRRIGIATVVLAIVATGLVPSASAAAPAGFVVASGNRLTVDGKRWRAVGVNFWDFDAAKVIGRDITGCYYQHPDLDAFFDATFASIAAETHATAVRTFGFRAMYTAGGLDWSATDKLVYYAQKHGIRLIPVLDDQYGSCGAERRSPAWYRGGYKAPEAPWGRSYRSYVVRVAARYRNSPAIAMWQLMNEAVSDGDDAALVGFARDMVRAIRVDAGDAYHPIDLGTASTSRPAFDRLLSCGASGGCLAAGSAHVYDPVNGIPGAPLPSDVTASFPFWNASGNRNELGHVKPPIEGWTTAKASPSSPASPYTRWGVRLVAPAGRAWVAYVDDVRLVTQTGVTVYSFETGTDGFQSDGATLSSSPKHARLGTSSLRVEIPAGTTSVVIEGPPVASAPTSVEAAIRLSMLAPAPRTGSGPAAMMNAAVAAVRRPFLFGELGIHAAVGPSKCNSYRSRDDRARLLDEVIGAQFDAERGSSGVLVWDWKDPLLQSTRPDGTTVDDPTFDCWSITPGDPANAVLRKWADTVAPAPMPAPVRTWSSARVTQVVLKAPGAVIPRAVAVPITVRLTRAGNPLAGVAVTATGCAGRGLTNALGHASFTCAASRLGDVTVSIRPSATQCACDVVYSRRARVKRAIAVAAFGPIVEVGKRAPVKLVIADAGGSLRGVAWRVPECGLRGTITSNVRAITIRKTCATNGSWMSGKLLTLTVPETASIAPASAKFAGIAFERMYYDPDARECVGLSPPLGWVGATVNPRACSGSAAYLVDTMVFQVPPSLRERAFVRSGTVLVASAQWRSGYRVDGRFEYGSSTRSFSALISRDDGVVAAKAA